MQDYLRRLLPALPRRAPDASSLFLHLQDSADPRLRDLAVASLDELGGGSGAGAGFGSFSAGEVAELQAECDVYSGRLRRRLLTDIAQPVRQLVIWIVLGQSLGGGWEALPPVSTEAAPDCFVVGGSVHPQAEDSAAWAPVGGLAVLNPFVANARGSILGETYLSGFAAQFRKDWLEYVGRPLGWTDNRWVFGNCAVGGKSNLALSPGAAPVEYFNKFRQFIDTCVGIAAANGWSVMVGGILHEQGQQDYALGTGFSTYSAGLANLIAAARAYAVSKTGQQDLIPVYLFQTGGQFTNDSQELQVARAQLAVADTVPGVFMAANSQATVDKGGHLSANGSCWNGAQGGKVATRTIIRREGWECTRPIRWVHRGRTVLGLFHTPEGPLRIRTPYVGLAPSPAAADVSRGVRMVDAGGLAPLAEVRPMGQVLGVAMGRDAQGTLKPWLGAKAGFNGAICIADSDATRLAAAYRVVSGQDPAEDLGPEVVGLTYDASNFSVADVQTSELV
jgi:hypothetical protein